MWEILLIIYIIGFVITWIVIKEARNISNDNDWIDVVVTFFLSLLSWATIAVIIISRWKDITNGLPKPPKWL